jgi:hypothetical protein
LFGDTSFADDSVAYVTVTERMHLVANATELRRPKGCDKAPAQENARRLIAVLTAQNPLESRVVSLERYPISVRCSAGAHDADNGTAGAPVGFNRGDGNSGPGDGSTLGKIRHASARDIPHGFPIRL